MQQYHHTAAAMSNNNTTLSDESHVQEFKKVEENSQNTDTSGNKDELQTLDSRTLPCLGDENEKKHPKKTTCSSEKDESEGGGGGENIGTTGGVTTVAVAVAAEETGRERLKRHRREVAGRVWIPEIWGKEELLKDWIDCSAFDASVMNSNIMSARQALMEEGRRATSSTLRIENSC